MKKRSQAQAKKPATLSDGAHPLVVLGAVAVIVLPAFVFLGARIQLPGDGARLQFEPFRQVEAGLLVTVSNPLPGGLQEGDRILALAGQSVDDWWTLGLRGTQLRPAAQSTLSYTVLRNGRVAELNVTIGRQSVADPLRLNWTSYLFLAYMWAIGLIVFVLRPRQANAQATLLFSSVLLGSGLIFYLQLQPSDLLHGWLLKLWIWGALVLYVLLAGGVIHYVLHFPKRRAVLRRRPYLPLAGYLGFLLLYLAVVAAQWREAGTSMARLYLMFNASGVLSATAFPLSVLIGLSGFRGEFNPVERRQARWFLWAGIVALIPWQVLSVIPELLGYRALVPQSLTSLFWLAIPTAMAIAILREGLFDIDLIINRTLVYGGLTAALAILYFASVASLQGFFRAAAGQESRLAIVLSTLGIAALSNPLRRRIQAVIDRRFYRRKFDAALLLAEFGRMVRDEVDLGKMQEALIGTVQETLQPAHLSLWVREAKPKD
ncbi:MAG: hypothetical protein ACRDHG_00730 [Anaerolineales bacterium]